MTNTCTMSRLACFLLVGLGNSLWAMNGSATAQPLQQRLQSSYSLSAEEDYALVFDHPDNVLPERRPIEPIMALIGKFLAGKLEFPALARLPRVEFASSARIVAIRYKSLSSEPERLWFNGRPNALDMVYDDAQGVIYLSEYWTGGSPAELSVLLHGLVNHMQREHGLTYACVQEREEVAFAAQEAWLKQFGRTLSDTFGLDEATYMLSTQCIP